MHIFISHSSRDAEAAGKIAHALERSGERCWMAPGSLMPGEQWAGAIVRAIEQSRAVLVVFSAASNDSPQMARELELAVSDRKRLIPIRIEDAKPTRDLQYFLGVSHWVDAFDGGVDRHIPYLVGQVRRAIAPDEPPYAEPAPAPRARTTTLRRWRWLWIPALVLAAIVVSKVWKPPEDEPEVVREPAPAAAPATTP